MNDSDKSKNGWIILGVIVFLFLTVLYISSWFWGPIYNVWQQGQEGKAALAKADYDRQTKVVEAQANLAAQKYNAESEVTRAQGVAQANNIIKNSITEMYIRYLWVNTLDKTNNQIIYVPEGADGLPITEAGRTIQPSK